MLTSLAISNFKCFADEVFEFGRLSLLSGPNGVGKSSVLQAILAVGQSIDDARSLNRLLLNGPLVELGSEKDVYSWAGSSSEIRFRFAFDTGHSRNLVFKVRELEDLARRPSDSLARVRSGAQSSDLHPLDDLFNPGFQYLSAARGGPARAYPQSEHDVSVRRFLGTRGEFWPQFLDVFAQSEVPGSRLHRRHNSVDTSLAGQLAEWMSQISPGLASISAVADEYFRETRVAITYQLGEAFGDSDPIAPVHVGFGVSYVAPLIIALLASRNGDLLLIENPEAHIHPSGQVALGRLMAIASQEGPQIICETHSDHLLNGVRLAVAERLLAPDGISLLHFARDPEDELTYVERIGVQADGSIKNWPHGFFDETERVLARMNDARRAGECSRETAK